MTYPRSGRHSNQLFCRQSLQPPLCVGGSACQQLGVRSGQIGVQAPLEREQSPSFADPIGISCTTGSFSSSSLGYGSSGINRERCGGSGPKPSFSGILREAIRGPQIFRGVEILIHASDRKFLRFSWRGQVYQFIAVPFGLAPAPWLFTKVTLELCRVVRGLGLRLRVYLDDWLLLATSETLCRQHLQVMLGRCQSLGFILNSEKSDLTPSQEFVYLGMKFNTLDWTVSPSPQRISRLEDTLNRLLSLQIAPVRLVASLLGSMESMATLIPLGRLHKRNVQRLFMELAGFQDWSQMMPLDHRFHSAVSQWLDQSWMSQGVPIALPPPQEFLYTDASQRGWGAHMGSLTASGLWDAEMSQLHINHLELEAVFLALKHFEQVLPDKHVLLNTDNTTVACYLNKQGGARSFSLSKRAEVVLLWCQERDISLTAKYIPGKLNILADPLSRSHMVLPTEWTIVHKALEPVWRHWFKPDVDLFATQFNKRLILYVSPVPDPQAWAIDAMSLPWDSLLAYAFPPLPILPKVLKKAREDQATLILIAPRWESQHWFPELLSLTHERPLQLNLGPRSLLQPRTGVPHRSPEVLNLHAWLLCGNRCQHEVLPQM